MTEITRWAVLIEGDPKRLAGGGDLESGMTYIWFTRKGAKHYSSQIKMGKPVKVTIKVER